jgi:uncharacterized protein RhaS with RHS repeats
MRDYEPMLGRWASKDPLLLRGDGPNVFGYVLGDPINLLDPTGECAICLAALAVAAAAATATAIALVWVLNRDDDGLMDSCRPRPNNKDGCYDAYLADAAYCGETYTQDNLYEVCMTNAWERYLRCLNGLPPAGPLVPRHK